MTDEDDNVVQMHAQLLKKKQLQQGMYMALQNASQGIFGKTFIHFKGGTYYTMGTALNTVNGTRSIIYMDPAGTIFTRPAHEFFGYVDKENEIKRFTELED